MPGKRRRKRSKYEGTANRELPLAEPGQDYAKVEATLGDCRFDVILAKTGQHVIAKVRGKLRHRARATKQSVILVSMRDFEPDKVDMIDILTAQEVRKLVQYGEVPPNFLTEESERTNEEDEVVFADSDEEESEELNVDDI